jgi:hypothetical protein
MQTVRDTPLPLTLPVLPVPRVASWRCRTYQLGLDLII